YTEQLPGRVEASQSMCAVTAGNKDQWLVLFDSAAVVQDPVGVSGFDATGEGHHGRAEIAKFWDASIANVSRFEFDIRDSHAAGDEVANVGTITTFFPGAFRVDTEGVFVYRVGEQGLILSMRAFWETERAMATARQVAE